MADPGTPAVIHDQPTGRVTRFRICGAPRDNGDICRRAALRGDDRCKYHSERKERDEKQEGMARVSIPRIGDLVVIDITTEAGLEAFRRGLLAHVGAHTLDPAAAKGMHELAMAIHNDARTKRAKSDGSGSLAAQLVKAFQSTRSPSPRSSEAPGGGEGGNAGEGESKGPTARTEPAP
jgi:hypothetical protein